MPQNVLPSPPDLCLGSNEFDLWCAACQVVLGALAFAPVVVGVRGQVLVRSGPCHGDGEQRSSMLTICRVDECRGDLGSCRILLDNWLVKSESVLVNELGFRLVQSRNPTIGWVGRSSAATPLAEYCLGRDGRVASGNRPVWMFHALPAGTSVDVSRFTGPVAERRSPPVWRIGCP
jgi:hypothetical protein